LNYTRERRPGSRTTAAGAYLVLTDLLTSPMVTTVVPQR